ncbi:T7SS effector LXG polymorphic toxin [Virgibacillus natechei]
MGHKVDIPEVITLSDELKTTSIEIEASLNEIKGNIGDIEAMDSFSGKAANAAKGYFSDFHNTVIESFNRLFTDLNDNLKKHVETFQSNVDSSESTIIESDYLTDHETDIDIEYQKLSSMHQSIKRAINNVADISSVGAPELYTVTSDKNEVIETVTELDENLSSFTSEGKQHNSQTKDLLQQIEGTMSQASAKTGEARFTALKANKKLEGLKDLAIFSASAIAGSTSSIAIAKAAKDKGLSVSKYTKNGKVTYRINASEKALKELGVKPDAHAARDLKKQKKSGNPKTALSYPENRTGKLVWSRVGQDATKNYPEMASFNDKASNMDKFKSVGNATYRGAKDSLTDLNPKNIPSNGIVRSAGKALGPLGVGLNYYSNYNDAKVAGLTGEEAYTRATVDTAIDTAISGGVQAGFTAAGTAFIPIPGVGTAIGAGVGIAANWALNLKFGDSDKSVMDRAKGAFHKVKGWFS